MRRRTPQIVAFGGGGFSMERDGSLLDDYVLSLLDTERPRVCFLPTASGDADHYVMSFYRRFSASCQTSHVYRSAASTRRCRSFGVCTGCGGGSPAAATSSPGLVLR